MGADLRISSEPMAPESDAQFVRDGLSLYNVARTGYDHWRPLKLFVRDATGLIRGGLLGHIWGGWLHITDLWLEEFARGAGLSHSLIVTAKPDTHTDGFRKVNRVNHRYQAPETTNMHEYNQLCTIN